MRSARAAVLGLLAGIMMSSHSCQVMPREAVSIQPIPPAAAFPDAVAPNALSRLCAARLEDVQLALTRKGLPFQADLVRTQDNQVCHIYYEPTVRDFTVAAEDLPVSELFFNVDTLAFLSHRDRAVGDSLDVAQSVLTQVTRPLNVTLGLNTAYPGHFYQQSAKKIFGNSAHQFHFQNNPAEDYDPWIQDFLKYGHTAGRPKVLITRRAFEGSEEMGRMLQPMLDSFREERFVRSKLSFEGGDLQFALHPKDRNRLVLFYGTAGKPYLGESLSNEEFAYVMRLEFGADEAVYVGDITPHVDYTVSLLPADEIALVAQPVCGNLEVARAALAILHQAYSSATPPELVELEQLLAETRSLQKDEVLKAIEVAKAGQAGWKSQVSPAVRERIGAYVATNCPHNPRACVEGDAVPRLLENHLQLLEDWVEAAAQVRLKQVLDRHLLAVIERQLVGCDSSLATRLDKSVQVLTEMGYRTIRVPWISGTEDRQAPWPGISYVNSALIDRTLFVPQLGLGRVEKEWMQTLAHELPNSYKVAPIAARFLLLRNGGIHCALAFGRTKP